MTIVLLGIVEKNRDRFSTGILDVLAGTYSKFLLALFDKELEMVRFFYVKAFTMCSLNILIFAINQHK